MSSPRTRGTRSHDWAPPLYTSRDLPAPSPDAKGRLAWYNGGVYVDSGYRWSSLLPAFDVVKGFGAIGDGSSHPLSDRFSTLSRAQDVYPHAVALTDEIDWAAWQMALNTIPSIGGSVTGPDGVYCINRTLDIPHVDAAQIYGTKAMVFKWTNVTASNIFRHTSSVSLLKRLVLQGFTVDGNHDICTGLTNDVEAFRIAQCDGVWIKNLTVFDTVGTAIYCGAGSGINAARIYITECDIFNVGCDVLEDGSSVEGINIPPNNQDIYEIVIANNCIHDEDDRTDSGGGCAGITVEANSGGHGRNVRIIGNSLYNLRSNGIKVGHGAQGFVVEGNTFRDVGVLASALSGAIICQTSDDGVIANNTVIENTAQGINIEDSKRILVHHNNITCTGNIQAIQIRDTAEDIIVENNSIFIANTGNAAAAIVAGFGTPVQTRCKIRNNYILSTVQPAAANGLILLLTGCTDFEIHGNTINNAAFTTIEAIKIGNGQTGMRITDNQIIGTATITFGNQTVVFREHDQNGNMHFGKAALATDATAGFLTIPGCAGTPTGTPANIRAGQYPLIWDSTNNKLYVYDAGWVDTT